MYKLLPEESKAKLRKEYYLRRYVMVLTALVFAIVVGLTTLYPSYLVSKGRQEEIAERARVLGEAGTPTMVDDDLEKWLADINLKLGLMSPQADENQVSSFIDEVINEKGAEIKISDFSWIKADSKVTFKLLGVALSRQALLAFEDRLKETELFSAVNLPVSNLAKESNIPFEIELIPKLSP